MSFTEFKNVCKMYPGSKVNTVDNFNLNIEEKNLSRSSVRPDAENPRLSV